MKYSFKQFKRNINNIFGTYDEELSSDDEKYIKSIITSATLKDTVDKVIVPVSGGDTPDYLLIDKTNEICISIENNQIDIANHNFLYKKKFNLNFTDEMKKIVKKKLEEERKDLKSTLFQNEIELLIKIQKVYDN